MYDWANSTYSLTITTAIFPIYFNAVTSTEQTGSVLTFWGISLANTVWYSYALSASFLLVALVNPLFSGVSDYSGRRKQFLRFFMSLGAFSCIALYWFDSTTIGLGLILFSLATIGYAGSLVFYNAYLPDIAPANEIERISARGFSYGYVGSVLLLIFSLLIIQYPSVFSLPEGTMPARLSFALVGIWWLAFGSYSLSGLPSDTSSHFSMRWIVNGYQEILTVRRRIQHAPAVRDYLLGMFFLSMGFQTIMYLASIFGSKELQIAESSLIAIILVIQLIAILGAFLLARLSFKVGNHMVLIIASIVSIGVCLAAFGLKTEWQFYILAVVVGLLMGGIQSLSRSTYAKMIPGKEENASYFSFYELVEKVGIVTGTLSYGLVEQLTGSMRNSALFLATYFILCILFLWRSRKKFILNF
jgi:UMF1 family MFS transporter